MSGRRIGLLMLILVMGGAVDAAWFIRRNVGVGANGCRVVRGHFYGRPFSFDTEQRQPLAEGGTVEVENAFGAVRIVQSATPELRVALRKVVYGDSEQEARLFADRLHLQIGAGAPLRVTTNRDELERNDPDVGFETHLELAVPKGTSVVVRNEHGRVDVSDVAAADVSGSNEAVRVERVGGAAEVRARHADVTVSDVTGALSLSARSGSVKVQDVQGALTLDIEHGDASLLRVGSAIVQAAHGEVRAQDVRGDLELHGQHVGVTAEDVDGRATIETTNQRIVVRRMGGEVRLKSAHGEITASEVDGPLTAEGTNQDIDIEQVTGPVVVRLSHASVRVADVRKGGHVSVRGGEVLIERFAGPLEIDAQRASVVLHPAEALTDALLARTTFGDIHLRVPDGSRMALDATSNGGQLDVDVAGLAVTRDGGHATGTLAGGVNTVRLFAEHGSVEVASALASTRSAERDDPDDDEEDPPQRSRE
jgi:putative adhesin